MKKVFHGFDYTLIITPLILATFGIVMIYSASMVVAEVEGLGSTFYFKRQLIWFVVSLFGFFFCCIFPYKYYQKFTVPIVFISFVLLISVAFFGDTVNKATRSIELLGINVQPSELVKLTLIIYIASVYAKKQNYIGNFVQGVIPPLVLTLGMVAFIVAQPDIGTATIILFIVAVIVASSGIRFRHLLLLFFVAAVIMIMVIPYLITDTRIARFSGAYQPFLDPEQDGYHLIQSYLAISGGGISGEGLGQSIQKLGYLWGAHTDFIMAVIAEELGVIGVVIVIGLFCLLTLRGLFFAKKCTDSFGSLLAIGITTMVGVQAIINLGAISGVFPITGVTLPFISYGGSSLFVVMISMGILNNVAKSVHIKDEQSKVVQKERINYKYGRGRTWSIDKR